MGDSTPVSDPENISTMKFLLAVVTLFAALACVLAESDPQLNYFYKSRAAVNGALGYPRAYGGYGGYRGYGGYGGYGGYYGGYNGYFRGKRSADAEPEANGDDDVKVGPMVVEPQYTYFYAPVGYNRQKRSAEAEPEPQFPYNNYNSGYYSAGGYYTLPRGYYLGGPRTNRVYYDNQVWG